MTDISDCPDGVLYKGVHLDVPTTSGSLRVQDIGGPALVWLPLSLSTMMQETRPIMHAGMLECLRQPDMSIILKTMPEQLSAPG